MYVLTNLFIYYSILQKFFNMFEGWLQYVAYEYIADLEIQKVVAEEPLNEYGVSVQGFFSIFILPGC
jgi:hypothetical protein